MKYKFITKPAVVNSDLDQNQWIINQMRRLQESGPIEDFMIKPIKLT